MQANHLRFLSVVFGLVILSFVTTTGYIGHRARAIDEAAVAISDNAAPSILHLSAARSEVRNLQLIVERDLDQAVAGIFPSPTELQESRARIHQDVRRYQQLPAFPGEEPLWERANRELTHLDDAVAHLSSQFAAHHAREASQLARGELQSAARQTVDAFMDTIEFNAKQAHDGAQRVGELRAGLSRSALFLTGLCVLWTLAAAMGLGYSLHRRDDLLEGQRRQAIERAEELEQFAGRVAHDILNPLSVVSSAFYALDLMRTADERASLVQRGRANVRRIQQILDGLLRFACAGARPEPGTQVALEEVFGELIPELRAQASEAGITLTLEPHAPVRLACSPGILGSLVSNLVHNAIKYLGDRSERRITVRVLERGAMVRFEVEDTGPGLPPDLERTVFDAYVRARGTLLPGFGLGLATVKKAAEAHGGRVGVRSVVGRGCLFWFELPLAAPPS